MAAKAIDFDPSQLEVHLNQAAIKSKANQIKAIALAIDDQSKIRDLVLAVRCIDLTTLGGDDTACNVGRLVWRALNPLSAAILEKLQPLGIEQPVTTAVICGYPTRAADFKHYLNQWHSDLPIATTVAGFPAGQGTVEAALSEVHYAVNNGANEIDIVINRPLAIDGQWRQLYEEIRAVAELMRQKGTRLKVILSTGELGTLENIYRAATVAMYAGANFVKTSTGKESLNAKLVYGLVMTQAIRDFYLRTGRKVGLKPAGGLKDGADALYWLTLVRTQLGPEWLNSGLFRLGASGMLSNIEKELYHLTQGVKATGADLLYV